MKKTKKQKRLSKDRRAGFSEHVCPKSGSTSPTATSPTSSIAESETSKICWGANQRPFPDTLPWLKGSFSDENFNPNYSDSIPKSDPSTLTSSSPSEPPPPGHSPIPPVSEQYVEQRSPHTLYLPPTLEEFIKFSQLITLQQLTESGLYGRSFCQISTKENPLRLIVQFHDPRDPSLSPQPSTT